MGNQQATDFQRMPDIDKEQIVRLSNREREREAGARAESSSQTGKSVDQVAAGMQKLQVSGPQKDDDWDPFGAGSSVVSRPQQPVSVPTTGSKTAIPDFLTGSDFARPEHKHGEQEDEEEPGFVRPAPQLQVQQPGHQRTVSHPQPPGGAPADLSKDELWTSFLNQAYMVGERYITMKLLSAQDCQAEKVYLYFGLSSLTLMEVLLRSLDITGVYLAVNRELNGQNCPPQHLELFGELMRLKKQVKDIRFTDQESKDFRLFLLYQKSREHSTQMPTFTSAERTELAGKIRAGIEAVTQKLCAIPFFRPQFTFVLQLLAETSPRAQSQPPPHTRVSSTASPSVTTSSHLAPPLARASTTLTPPVSPGPSHSRSGSLNAPLSPAVSDEQKRANDPMWDSFFNSVFVCVEKCRESKLITPGQIKNRAEYLFVGLTAVTLLELLGRSTDIVDGIRFDNGMVLTKSNCPAVHERILASILTAKAAWTDARISPTNEQEQDHLRRACLFTTSPFKDSLISPVADSGRSAAIKKAADAIGATATLLSLFTFFKTRLDNLLELASA